MVNIDSRERDFPVAPSWPEPIVQWYRQLLGGVPNKPPDVNFSNWQLWLKSAEKHGICSLVFSRLYPLPDDFLPPPEIFSGLRMAYFADVAHIMIRRTQMEYLLQCFEAVGISTLVLKGAALGEMLYEEVFQRPTADIDILVSKDDYNQARSIMIENGYRSKRGDRSQQMEWSCDEEFMPAIDDMNRQFVVELHWGLTSHAQLMEKIKTEHLFFRSEKVDGMNQPLTVLSQVDALVFACLHLFYKHINELRLIWLYDIHLLAERVDVLGLWTETIEQSLQWQGRLALKNSLELARDWYGTKFPDEVSNLNFGPPDREETQLYNMVIFNLEHGSRQGWIHKHLFQLSRLRGWNKVRYLLSRFFPTRQEIEANYPGLRAWPGPLVHIGRFAMIFLSKK